MRLALELAQSVIGRTSPNPAVGAVVVRDGAVVGQGATQPPGQAHAEVGALAEAGALAEGATLYVTLEPCCHWGRTPPCTRAIIASGVRRVVYGAADPNPLVSGNGAAELRAAGIEVAQESDGGLTDAGWPGPGLTELYEAFARHITTGRPFIIAKYAMSLDGKIAARSGDSKWVTGPAARQRVQQLRRAADGILVGVNTAIADNPALTVRDAAGTPEPRQPLRVVLDSHARLPPESGMLRQPGQTIVYTTGHSDDGAAAPGIADSGLAPAGGATESRVAALTAAGAEVVALPPDANGQVSAAAAAADLGARGVVSLIVEGGGATLGAFFDAGLVDKVCAFIAPVIIGGAAAIPPVAGLGVPQMAEAWDIDRASLERLGPDWLITGYPRRRSGG